MSSPGRVTPQERPPVGGCCVWIALAALVLAVGSCVWIALRLP